MTIEAIKRYDEAYRARTAHLGGYGTKPQGPCWWADCGSDAYARGLCSRHYQQMKNGTLFKPDFGDAGKGEINDFARRFAGAAESAGVTPGELVAAALVSAVRMAEGVVDKLTTEQP